MKISYVMKTSIFIKLCLFIVNVMVAFPIHAQSFIYHVDFTGSGAANHVDSVKIHNIAQDQIYMMSGTDTLVLWDGTLGNSTIHNKNDRLNLYPNPTASEVHVSFNSASSKMIHLSLFDMMGKQIAEYTESGLQAEHHFRIGGLNKGLYLLVIENDHDIYAEKILSTAQNIGPVFIEKKSSTSASISLKTSNERSYFYVNCEDGDMFHFTAYAGDHAVVTVFYATHSTTINSHFQYCMDADQNHYPIVYIGQQAWMAENLTTTKYSDGTNIANVINGATWVNLTTGAFCWYNNNAAFQASYGALYNWYAISLETNGGKNPCPDGWKVPSDEEWTSMTNFVGGFPATGGRLKETGFTHWNSPNTGATNEVAFSARPGGSRIWNGNFDNMNTHAYFWTSSEQQGNFAWLRNMFHNAHNLGRGSINKYHGLSIRCIKE